MPDNLFIPSVDMRIGALEEYNRRQKAKAEKYISPARTNHAPASPFHGSSAARPTRLPKSCVS